MLSMAAAAAAIIFLYLSAAPPRYAAAGALDGLHSLVLIPGFASNQLDARLTDDYRPSAPHCGEHNHNRWFRLFLNAARFQDPDRVPCFLDQFSLMYASTTADAADYSNVPGVETRVPFFGSTSGIRYVDPDRKDDSTGFAVLLDRLEAIGYVDGKNLFGAPYDFRYAPVAPPHSSKVGNGFIRRLAELVESASAANGDKPVIILSHSLGCTLAYYLLAYSPPSWRQRYVKHFIALAGAWGGSLEVMLRHASGYDLGLQSVDPSAMKQQWQSMEISLLCLPVEAVFGETPLVITARRSYSAADVVDFLRDINNAGAVEPYLKYFKPLFPGLPAPGVPVTHIHGTGIPTAKLLYFAAGGFDAPPEIVYGDGDGEIGDISLSAIEKAWAGVPGQFLKVVKIANASHVGMLVDDHALELIIKEVVQANMN